MYIQLKINEGEITVPFQVFSRVIGLRFVKELKGLSRIYFLLILSECRLPYHLLIIFRSR